MILPQDYVNYTKISWVDSAGIKHLLYPTSKTSNPTNPLQDSVGDFILQAVGTLDENSEDVVLDAEYKDILVGMIVKGPYIPDDTVVGATSNSSSITTITLHDSSGAIVDPSENLTNATLTFEDSDGFLLLPQKSSHIVETLTWAATGYPDNKITANAAADIADIKVGMLVSHDVFDVGTVVTNVDGTTIIVSNDLNDTTSVTAGEILFVSPDLKDTDTWSNYKSGTPSENQDDYQDDTYWPMDGSRYGLDPQHAQANGSFYIDCVSGKIHFSSNISGKTVILDYISDSLGTDGEMQVHKFAEEAMYKWVAHAILSTSSDQMHQQLVPRFKKERFAAIRTAKLRLSNIKLEEITQILRGKSKQIKH
tara:strand:- start:480 stop:1577 length:1098 start_codon:yes stop_codon:yes gene_type:complete